MNWTIILVLAGLGVVLLIVGICIMKKALKMKAQGKENFKLYATGGVITMPGTILLIFCALEVIVNAIL